MSKEIRQMINKVKNFKQFVNENLQQNNNLNIQYYDLFEHYEMQPPKLKEVVDRWDKKLTDGLSYDEVSQFLRDVEKVGYTFDYYLDAVPYGLRPIGIELNQLKGWEDIDN